MTCVCGCPDSEHFGWVGMCFGCGGCPCFDDGVEVPKVGVKLGGYDGRYYSAGRYAEEKDTA